MEELEGVFFEPTTRMHDLMSAWNNDHDDERNHFIVDEDHDFEEVELRAGAENGTVDLLHPDFTFDEFWWLARRKFTWLGRDIFVSTFDSYGDDNSNFWWFFEVFEEDASPLFSVDGLDAGGLYTGVDVYSRTVMDTTTTFCDYVFRLMTRSNTIWTNLYL